MNDFLAKNSDMLKNVSIAVLLIAILYLGMNGQWVFGKDHENMKASYEKQLATVVADRDEWKKLALDGLLLSKNVSSVRVPIMSSGPTEDLTPKAVAQQLEVIKSLNSEDGVEQ